MPDYLIPDTEIPDHLPGEPRRPTPAGFWFLVRLDLRALGILVLAILNLPLWVPYLVGVLIAGRPPNVPRGAQVARYVRLIWARDIPPPGLRATARVWLTLSVLRKVAVTPAVGLAWLLDDLIYGRALARTAVVAPLIEISAARSGSTQLARYLEADPRLVAPNVLQTLFPYLWLWRIVPPIATRLMSREAMSDRFHRMLPPEFLERHEGDLFGTDTFELGLYNAHLNALSLFLGPDALAAEFGMGVLGEHNRRLWTEDFVEYLDGVARKVLLFSGGQRRFFVKGHFLAAADALAERYPDGRFLTLVRPPAKRLQSAINFLWSNPVEIPLGSVPWRWVAEGLARSELDYNRAELEWFTRPEGPRRCVLRFGDYVRDLEGTMARVYRECLDEETVPPHVPRQHAPRERKDYSVDRSLARLGIDGAAYEAAQPEFVAWCAAPTG